MRNSDLLENIKFNAAGKFTSRGEWIHPSVSCPTTEIIIVTEGSFKLSENGQEYDMTAGNVLFLAPDLLHSGVSPVNEKVSFYWIHMTGFDMYRTGAPAKFFSLREPHHISILCRQLLHYSATSEGSDVPDKLLSVLLYELARQSAEDDSENALVSRMYEWIRINSDRNVTPKLVAEKFGYNEDYVSRLFKRHFGVGIKSRINELKLGLIKKYLLETDMTLAEIADAVGFTDYKLFLKYFKYHTDMSPGKFKKAYYAIHTNNK